MMVDVMTGTECAGVTSRAQLFAANGSV